MASNDYFTAAYPDTWQILGVQLRPFSLGHYFKLRRLKNAFVSDESTTASLGDLIMGIVVCSMPSSPVRDTDPFWQWLDRKPTLLVRCINLFFKSRLTQAQYEIYRWGKKCSRNVDFKAKVELFAKYISYHSELPEFFEENPDKTTWSGAHWSQGLVHSLTTKCGYSMQEAYNASLRKCFADFYKLMEAEGMGHIAPDL